MDKLVGRQLIVLNVVHEAEEFFPEKRVTMFFLITVKYHLGKSLVLTVSFVSVFETVSEVSFLVASDQKEMLIGIRGKFAVKSGILIKERTVSFYNVFTATGVMELRRGTECSDIDKIILIETSRTCCDASSHGITAYS